AGSAVDQFPLARTDACDIHGQRASRSAVEHVDAHVRRDPVEPRTQPGVIIESRQCPPCPEHRVLHRVFGFVRRAEHPVAVANQLAAVPLQLRGLRHVLRAHCIHQSRLRLQGGRKVSRTATTFRPSRGCTPGSSNRRSPSHEEEQNMATSRSLISAMQLTLDGYSSPGDADWVDSWADGLDLLPPVDAFILGGGMFPDYEQFWATILDDRRAASEMLGRDVYPREMAYARFAVHTPHLVVSKTLHSRPGRRRASFTISTTSVPSSSNRARP